MRKSKRAAIVAIRALPWAILLALVGLNLLYICRLGPNDDAYITYRVARNLASGVGPVYNPGERVLSVTTPGYMLLLAASSVFSGDFVALGLALNGLALLAAGALLIDLSRPAPLRSNDFSRSDERTAEVVTTSLAAAVAVTLTLTFPLLTESLGMETPLYVAALLATFAAYRRALALIGETQADSRQRERRWLLWTAAAAAAAFLLRPDGLLVGVAVGLHWLITQRRVPWAALALGLVLSLPWVLFAWAYYGSPIPNTLVAKMTQAMGTELPGWGAALLAAAREWATGHLLAASLAIAGLFLALRQRRADRLPMLLWAALYVVGHVLLNVRSYFWYYAPLAPVAALLAGDGAAWLAASTRRWLARSERSVNLQRTALALATLVLIALTLYPAVLTTATLATPPIQRRRELIYQQTGAELRQLCQPGDLAVGMAEVGILGYVSDCRVVDFAGLLQRDVAHLQQGPQAKTEWALKRYAPPLVLLAGGVGYPHAVAGQPWFRQRYAPAQVHEEGGFRAAIYQRGLGPSQEHDVAAGWWRVSAGQPVTATLIFPAGVVPSVAVHAYLPPGSSLEVAADGQPLTQVPGEQASWVRYPLPALDPGTLAQAGGAMTLTLQGAAGSQPAAVAWLESNALPTVHYFAPLEDASTRPYPSVRLEQGQVLTATLAAVGAAPLALEVMHRDRPGVALDVWVNGRLLGTVGGNDEWRVDRLVLPADVGPRLDVELRNRAAQFARVAHVAVAPVSQAMSQEVAP